MIEAIKAIDGYEAMNPADILAVLQANTVTYRAVNLGELMFMMNARDMLTRTMYADEDGIKWSGTVVNMLKHVRDNVPELVGPVNKFYSHITFEKNRTFDTSDVQYGGQLALLSSSFGGQTGMPTVADFQAIADLGGGWKYADIDADDVQAALDAEAARLAAEAAKAAEEALQQQRQDLSNLLYGEAWNANVAPALDGDDPTVTNLVVGIRALADALENA